MKLEVYLENNNNVEVTPPVLWDSLKAMIRGEIIAISSYKKKMRKQDLNRMQKEHTLQEDNKCKVIQ